MSVTLVAPPSIGGSFDLIDHDDRSVSDRSFLGRYAIVFFGFSHCRVVCPRALQRLSDALDRLGDTGEGVQGLYITVDPDRDTPARLQAFLSAWPRFLGLTGSCEQIARARAAFRVYAEKREAADGYEMLHSAVAHLIDPAGGHIDHWHADLSADEIAERLKTVLWM
jgi:protein SCO1/2